MFARALQQFAECGICIGVCANVSLQKQLYGTSHSPLIVCLNNLLKSKGEGGGGMDGGGVEWGGVGAAN